METHGPIPDHPFLFSQITELGISRSVLRRCVAEGSVRRPFRGVYVPADAPDSLEIRARAASLVVPNHCVVSDRTAAWVYGIDCLGPDGAERSVVDLVSRNGAPAINRVGVRGGERDLADHEVTHVHGCMITTPLRTACDVACLRGETSALAVLDGFSRQYSVSKQEYVLAAKRFAGRRGVKQLRRLAPHASPLAESPAESWTRAYILDAGIGPVDLQVRVDAPGWGTAYLDMALTRHMVAIEYDGEDFHTSPEDQQRDAARRAAIERLGWSITVVTKADLAPLRRALWLAKIEQTVRLRQKIGKRQYSRGQDNYRGPVRAIG